MDEDPISRIIDPLSTALTKIKLRAFNNVALDAGRALAVDFPACEGFTFNVVQKGSAGWL